MNQVDPPADGSEQSSRGLSLSASIVCERSGKSLISVNLDVALNQAAAIPSDSDLASIRESVRDAVVAALTPLESPGSLI